MHFNRNILYKTTKYMNNSNQESTSFIYKKILSQLNPLNDTFLSFHPCGTIGSQLWNDRITQVE